MNEDYSAFVDIFDNNDGAELIEMQNTDDGCSSQIYYNFGLPVGSSTLTSLRVR